MHQKCCWVSWEHEFLRMFGMDVCAVCTLCCAAAAIQEPPFLLVPDLMSQHQSHGPGLHCSTDRGMTLRRGLSQAAMCSNAYQHISTAKS